MFRKLLTGKKRKFAVMKPKVFLFLLPLMLFAALAKGQVFKGFVNAGLNMTQVDGDEVYGYKMPGLHIGPGVMLDIGGNFDLSLEAAYTQRGANQKAQYFTVLGGDTLTGAYRLRLNYFQVPLMIHYTDKDLFTAGFGFSYARLVRAEEYEHGRRTLTNANNQVYSPHDFNVLLDLKYRMTGSLRLSFRYEYSVASIRTREYTSLGGTQPWTRKQYNNVISLRLFYLFNEERAQRNKTASQN
ncbi:MAG TPA: outer membrane beta-barrel protein [Bacteroidales bacterium]|nr:outer membrane beta-barrel protein [Bacteroidales bacterium]